MWEVEERRSLTAAEILREVRESQGRTLLERNELNDVLIDVGEVLRCNTLPAGHHHTGLHLPECSELATHYGRLGCVGEEGFACEAIATWMADRMLAGMTCPGCKKPTTECWKLRPI